ncbi:MAG: hypothetical protein PHV02_10420 [Rhodocyclaceae bacterium]|nr:hypothetical protein [Rhodocyclaceae bacterium]
MTTTAKVAFFKNQFVVDLNDGRHIEQSDLLALAKDLHRAGVNAKDVEYEWRPGFRMITAGQQVALRAALRHQEQKFLGLAIAA